MSTFADIKARIADELARTDLTSQINLATLSAIQFYERKRWYFTETRAMTLPTVNGQEFYGAADLSDIANLLKIDSIRITVSTTSLYQLIRKPYEYIEEINIGDTAYRGIPIYFAWYAQQIRLYPVPTAVYTLRISGVHLLTTLSAGTDTNNWTNDAEDLIRYRAKWDLYSNVIGDQEQAQAMKSNEAESLQSLIADNNSRDATGFVTATTF